MTDATLNLVATFNFKASVSVFDKKMLSIMQTANV